MMKLMLAIEAGAKLAKRFGVGVKDIRHLHKAFKKNKLDPKDTPEGQFDYVRLAGFVSFSVSLVFGILYAFGKIDAEVYEKLKEIL